MDGRRMAGFEVDLWPPIARITSLFDQKIEKYGSGGQIWMVDAAVWATRFFDLKKRKKTRGGTTPPTLSVWLKTTSLFDEKRRKQKI